MSNSAPNYDGGILSVINFRTGLLLHGKKSDNYIYQNTLKSSKGQQWRVERVNSEWFKIVHKETGKVLDGKNSSNKVYLNNWNGGSYQMWKFETLNNGNYKIIHKKTSRVLDSDRHSDEVFTNDWDGGKTQHWKIIESIGIDNWLRSIPGDTPINHLSIPGTHESASRHAGAVPDLVDALPFWGKCQSKSISSQLGRGIRYLDLRGKPHGNCDFKMYHAWVDQKKKFSDIVSNCTHYLRQNSSEFVIVQLKQEDKTWDNFQDIFECVYQNDPNVWCMNNDIPTLDQVRGKMVLFNRFKNSYPRGINVKSWHSNEAYVDTSSLVHKAIQDLYEMELDKSLGSDTLDIKYNAIKAFQEGYCYDRSRFNLNFTTAARPYTPEAFSRNLNPRVFDLLVDQQAKWNAIIPMDFIEDAEKAVTRTITNNFFDHQSVKF